MTEDEAASRRWRWFRVAGAEPAEAVHLSADYPDVDPGRPQDIPAAADLLAQYRAARRPR